MYVPEGRQGRYSNMAPMTASYDELPARDSSPRGVANFYRLENPRPSKRFQSTFLHDRDRGLRAGHEAPSRAILSLMRKGII